LDFDEAYKTFVTSIASIPVYKSVWTRGTHRSYKAFPTKFFKTKRNFFFTFFLILKRHF
jgi:hypothetical protein